MRRNKAYIFSFVLTAFAAHTALADNRVTLSDTSGYTTNESETVVAKEEESKSTSTHEVLLEYCPDITPFEENKIPVDSATFFRHVNQLGFEIPLDYNDEVKRLIDYFGTAWQGKLKEMIRVSQHYFPIYESVFDKHNVPLELKYVSVIESALNPYATSRSGAVGLWQFMPYTGKLYGMEINRYQDERRDVYKSTEGAARYFSDMSKMFDDWLVVIASYNCGPGNIRKAMRRSGGKTGFWEIYPYLPKQTRNYIPSFIAVAYLMNFYDQYSIYPTYTELPTNQLIPVTCTGNHNLQAISEITGVSLEDLRTINPALKTNNIPFNVDEMQLHLPESAAMTFIDKEDEILKLSEEYKPQTIEKVYVVRRGDSLNAIANRHGCSIQEIKEWNNLRSNMIHPGNRLTLYL